MMEADLRNSSTRIKSVTEQMRENETTASSMKQLSDEKSAMLSNRLSRMQEKVCLLACFLLLACLLASKWIC